MLRIKLSGFAMWRRRLPAHPSTVADKALARYVVTGCAAEEDCEALEILWGSPSARGYALHNLAGACWVGNESTVHFGGDVA